MPITPKNWIASRAFRLWLLAFAICAIASLLSALFVDLPAAKFFHTLSWATPLQSGSLGLPILIVLSGLVVVACGVFSLSGHLLPDWTETAMLAALSLICGVFLTDLVLKPLFGRTPPGYLIQWHQFQFNWLKGNAGSSFPSTHAVQIASIASVLWQMYPRWRVLYALVALAVFLALIVGNWHFISDVIAGGFVGVSAGLMIVSMWRTRSAGRRPG